MEISKFVGVPFEVRNCFEIVKDFYKENFDLDLSQYYEGKHPGSYRAVESLINSNRGYFHRVEGEAKAGDIVVIKYFGISCHIGVYIGKGKVLHSLKDIGSCIDSIDRMGGEIDGIYRHREVVP